MVVEIPVKTDRLNRRDRAEVTAAQASAMIAMRDGAAELRSQHATWAHQIFARALQTKDDSVHRFRGGLRFNPIAIAYTGMIHCSGMIRRPIVCAHCSRSPPEIIPLRHMVSARQLLPSPTSTIAYRGRFSGAASRLQ
jgi:hypothetical protein